MENKRKLSRYFVIATFFLQCLVLGTVPMTAYAEGGNEQDGIWSGDWRYVTFGSAEQYACIAGYKGTDTSIEIPDQIDGKIVKEIFWNAFQDNIELKSVSIPASVEEIRDEAFSGCTSLESVSIREVNSDTEENDWREKTFTIGKSAFLNCVNLTEFPFPQTTKAIGDRAFEASGLEGALTLPESVTEIGEKAFVRCDSLTEVTVPAKLNMIGKELFSQCTSLVTAVIEDGVSEIGEGMFLECTALVTVEVPDSVTRIRTAAFKDCVALMDLELPNSVHVIGDSVFENDGGFAKFVLPDSVHYIGDRAYANCVNLRDIDLSANLKWIGEEAFLGDTSLVNVFLVDGAETIGPRAFKNCTGLEDIWMPASIKDLFYEVFVGCDRLTIHTTEDALQVKLYANEGRAPGSELTILYDYQGSAEPYVYDDVWRYQVNEDDTITIVKYLGEEEESDIVIPDEIEGYPVREIGSYAFLGHLGLDGQKVFIPNSVRTIGDSAFNDCVTLKIWVPKTVTAISSSAFSGLTCSKIYTEGMASYVINYMKDKRIPYEIPITSIAFAKDTYSLHMGDDGYLGVKILPENHTISEYDIKWESSDTEVVDMADNSWVWLYKPGTATVTVSAVNGFTGEVVKTSCVVKVAAKEEESTEDDTPVTPPVETPSTVTNPPATTNPPAAAASSDNKPAAKGTTLTVSSSKCKVKVLSGDASNPTVAYTGTTNKNTAALKVPDTVKVDNVTYKVVSIADKAFSGNKKVKSITIGKNVTSIGKNAFKNCTKLKTVDVKSTVLNKIGANAFSGDKALTKINLKTTKLTSKSIGKNALKGTNKKLVIKVPKKKVSAYKKYFKDKGNKAVVVKK